MTDDVSHLHKTTGIILKTYMKHQLNDMVVHTDAAIREYGICIKTEMSWK